MGLQSCVRLAQGHARLMFRNEVKIQDAVMAVVLLESSTESSSSLLKGVNPLHTAFPVDVMSEYSTQARLVLTGLGLSNLWTEEKNRLEEVMKKSREGDENVEERMTLIGASQAKSGQADLTQVLRNIQMNRAVTLPQPEVKKKRGRKRKRVVDTAVVEREESVDNEEESVSGDDIEESNRNEPKSPNNKPTHNSTVLMSPTSSNVVGISPASPGLSPILSEENRPTNGVTILAGKTLSKLGKFRRLDKEENLTEPEKRSGGAESVVDSGILTLRSTSVPSVKSDAKSSLARLAAKIQARALVQPPVVKPVIRGVSNLGEEDLDFELDL